VNQIDSYLFPAESKKMDIILIYPKIKINLRREKMKKYKVLNSRQKKMFHLLTHGFFALIAII